MKALNTNKLFLKLLLIAIGLCFCVKVSFAQPALPQRTLTVTATQAINFGSFCVTGAGGTVIVDCNGTVTKTGEIAPLAISPTARPAIFEIKLCQGRNVNIDLGGRTTLTGSNGGTLWLDMGPTNLKDNNLSFITNRDCNFITTLLVGGTLTIVGYAPPGSYSGDFAITFNQE